MHSCSHANLVQLPEKEKRMKCRHCHLTIKAEDLKQGYCPECFDRTGNKRYDFEAVEPKKSAVTRYRCEDCGIIIESD